MSLAGFRNKLQATEGTVRLIKWWRVHTRRSVTLTEDLRFYSRIYNCEIVVPKGLVSDGASVPQIFWKILPPFGKYLESAVLHDWLCLEGYARRARFGFFASAVLFFEAMRSQDVALGKCVVMSGAVILFGPRFAAQKRLNT